MPSIAEMDATPRDAHDHAFSVISPLIDGFGYGSALDVGVGAGRGVMHLIDRHPDIEVRGVEPVQVKYALAQRRKDIPEGCIVKCAGAPLPFGDDTFDSVCGMGVLRHFAEPDTIVREMTRVARSAVFLSDLNRFAHGGRLQRAAKYVLYRLGLWQLVYRLANGGRTYPVAEGSPAYSYSLYDSLPALDEWADRIFLVPTVPSRAGWFHPLFGADHLLLCGLRDD